MFCPNCGASNPEGAKFCNECGINLTEALKDINESQDSDDTFEAANFSGSSNAHTVDPLNYDEQEFEEDSSAEDEEDSNSPCIICKAGYLIPTLHSGTLGIGTKQLLVCNSCGAVFEKKGQKYKLSKISDSHQPLWIRYHNQTLTEDEWLRIGDGGVSDAEQKKIDEKKLATQKKEAEKQRETDTNEFLTELQAGKIFIKFNGPSPVILKKNESILLSMGNIYLQEPRAVRQTCAAYGGPTIRVAKGVSFRVGGAQARSESHDEIKRIDQGQLVLTNKRLIFVGSKRTVNIDLRKIMAIEAYRDGIESQRENKQKPEYFTGTNEHAITFNINGRQGTVPVYGNVLKAAIQGAITQL